MNETKVTQQTNLSETIEKLHDLSKQIKLANLASSIITDVTIDNLVRENDELKNRVTNLNLYLNEAFSYFKGLEEWMSIRYSGIPGYVKETGVKNEN